MYCRNCGSEMHEEAVVCVKCGVPAGKGKSFCPTCGAATNEEAVVCVSCGVALQKAKGPKKDCNIQPRNLVTAIILSIVTCGIYGIVWFVKLTNEMNELSGNEGDPSGGTCILLTLVTCGIYSVYWAYKMGEKQDQMTEKQASNNILYLVLTLVGLGIVAYAMLQDAINKYVGEN